MISAVWIMSGWYVCQARASGDSGLAADLTKHGQNGPRAAANQPSVSGSRATFLLLSLTKYAPNRSGKRGIRSSAREDKEGISSRVTEIDHGLFQKERQHLSNTVSADEGCFFWSADTLVSMITFFPGTPAVTDPVRSDSPKSSD